MVLLYFLKKVDIFKGLEDDQLNRLLPGCQEKPYNRGERLFAEGEKADRVWCVMDGQVDLRFELPGRPTSEQNTVFSIGTGNTLGWSSFVPDFQYKLAAYCASRSGKILQIKKDFLIKLFEEDHRMGYRTLTNLAGVASRHFHRLANSASDSPMAQVKITIHMGTCGIAAGAREVMNALVEELSRADRPDIEVVSSGCLGRCETEPNVTVEIDGQEPVVYQKMTPEKIRRVFKDHILGGDVQTQFALN